MYKDRKVILIIIALTAIVVVIVAVLFLKYNFLESSYSSSFLGFNSESKISRGLFKQDNKAPAISFNSPVNNFCRLKSICQFVSGETVNISVDVTDNVAIKSVEIYIDDLKQKLFTQPTYEFIWSSKTVTNGPHTIKIIAVDTVNNETTLSTDFEVKN